ncbi:MAG TPA: ABC transporter substrate-binding protein [Solirubrobacteraceae bacterium]|nr:ABC transporter substrate-binding protein [Solirubrobacteraceae bacterium]
MSTLGTRLRFAALAAAAVVLIAACGSSSNSSSSASSSSAPAAAASSSTTSAAASSGSGKTYVVITSADFPPFSSRSADDPNTIVGFEPDMVKALMAHLGWKYKWATADFDGLIPAVQSGRADMVVSDVYDTAAREKVVDFTDYLKTALSLMVTSSNASKVHGWMDVCGKPVGILTGAATELEFSQKASKACTAAGKPAIDIHSYSAVAQEVPALKNGNLYAMYEDTITEHLIANKQPDFKVVFDDPEASTPLGIAIKKGSPIEAQLKSAMKWYVASSQYKDNATKWGLPASALVSQP